jgi:hypothetical protein
LRRIGVHGVGEIEIAVGVELVCRKECPVGQRSSKVGGSQQIEIRTDHATAARQRQTGYGSSNPAYEEFYSKGIPAGTPSALGADWVYLSRCSRLWLIVRRLRLKVKILRIEPSIPNNWIGVKILSFAKS